MDSKYGTDDPSHPTDEFVIEAFARGAKELWPDSRDPGWWITFQRWLNEHDHKVWEDGFLACQDGAHQQEDNPHGAR